MGKILAKVEPVNLPIVGYEKGDSGSRLKIMSNRTPDETNGNLNDATLRYKEDNNFNAIYVGIKGYNGNQCLSLNIADAEELIESLQSMVKIIKGNN